MKTSVQATAIEPVEVPVPTIATDEILVRVGAVGVGIRDGGSVMTISDGPSPAGRDIRIAMLSYDLDVRAELLQLMTDVFEKKTRVQIEQVYPFEDALTALAKGQTRHARGKLVLTLG